MTSRASRPRLTGRSVLWASALALPAALIAAGGCSSEDLGPISATGAVAGSQTTTTVAGSGGFTASTGGGSSTAGSAVTTGGAAGKSSVGGSPSSGVSGSAPVAGSGGVNSGGTGGSAPKPCVDVEPPPDPTWPDATCESWATETTECTASWFASYCDVSCKRCVPAGGSGGSGAGGGGSDPAAVDCSTKGLPNVTGGEGYTTRYWDCCQTHCSQNDGHRCDQSGTQRTGNNQSACSGGGSFACYDEAPKAVNDCLSYGYIAKTNPNCGGCYRIQFTGQGQYNDNDPGSKLIKGKQMIVKVSNTGGDVAGNQFDLMIPGGGVGKFDACSRQWNATDLGAQYGGFLTNCSGSLSAKKDCVRQGCMKIPAGPARDGCIWFVDWFNVADNPKFTSQSTDCPF
jgi:glycosyl hydrolase family 45